MGPSGSEYRRVPPIAVSSSSTLVNHTGSWKYIRPLFQDRVAPCNAGCPVGIDIEGYMNLLREGRVAEARDLLLRENPMPGVTGRVCHHPCEVSCNRESFDRAVAVHAVERMLGDLAMPEVPLPAPPARNQRVAIVGSGPAGLACAYHLAGLGYRVTVFEAATQPGGMLRLAIPEYRLPEAVLDREIERIRARGVEIICCVNVGDDLPWWSVRANYDAVFLAPGAHRDRALEVEGEQSRGVEPGLKFLEDVKRGNRPNLGRQVIVVGGGNTAIDCARTAVRMGADCLVLYRRTRAEMPAIPDEVEEAEREGVKFEFLAAPVAFESKRGRLKAVECVRMRLGPPDASGRRRPIPVDSDHFTLPADTVLTAVGEVTDLAAVPQDLERQDSALRVGAWGETSGVRVFAGGDVTDETRSVAHALGAGKRAAIGIDRYLRQAAGEPVEPDGLARLRYGGSGNVSITRWRGDDPIQRASPTNDVVRFEDLNPSHFQRAARRDDRRLHSETARSGFTEVNLGLTRDGALEEARRCFNCAVCNGCELCLIFCPDVAIARGTDGNRFDIALDYCKGCGVCAAECPRGGITMTRAGL
ncbi:MAG: FAD-dependent oxidoreductase [Gemmatimonadetes bacterium]|nr:FAD-dependent oxidoreductase [Gemmatimonadota bacterium]